jgi:hypothetical protein
MSDYFSYKFRERLSGQEGPDYGIPLDTRELAFIIK